VAPKGRKKVTVTDTYLIPRGARGALRNVARDLHHCYEGFGEIGIDINGEFPKPWTPEFLDAADVVVTLGWGESCPLVNGKHYEDWELDEPTGKTLDEIRPSATRSALTSTASWRD
jgi:protein-tyrosine-phosphatase